MPDQTPSILDLQDDEVAPYGAILKTLDGVAARDQVLAALQDLELADEPTARVAQRLSHLLHDDASIPRLIAALPVRSLSYPAALLLGWFGARAQAAVPALIEAIGWGPTLAVGTAVRAVVSIGGDAQPLLDGLTRAMRELNDDAYVQLSSCAEALGLSEDDTYLMILASAAANANPAIREWTADVIGRLPAERKMALRGAVERLTYDEVG